jgi:hypothetical protein
VQYRHKTEVQWALSDRREEERNHDDSDKNQQRESSRTKGSISRLVGHFENSLNPVAWISIAMAAIADAVISASIDIGSSTTGFSWSLNHQLNEVVFGAPDSEDSASEKSPTVVLINSSNKVTEFGVKAKQVYISGHRPASLKLFSFFKMHLYNVTNEDRDPLVASADGHGSLPLSIIITGALEFLMKSTLKSINATQDEVTFGPRDVHWILTVPAIWSHYSKDFMRKCAYRAGLVISENSTRLDIVLEPEAAAVYILSRGKVFDLRPTDKFMVCDGGGGTFDITVRVSNTAFLAYLF